MAADTGGNGTTSRYKRRTQPRAKTIRCSHLTKAEREQGKLLVFPQDVERPRIRADCENAERPCPYVGCKYHLYLDVNPDTGSIKLNFPHLEPWELPESCSLDVAERGGITLEEVGHLNNITRERVRQMEVKAVLKLRRLRESLGPTVSVDAAEHPLT